MTYHVVIVVDIPETVRDDSIEDLSVSEPFEKRKKGENENEKKKRKSKGRSDLYPPRALGR